MDREEIENVVESMVQFVNNKDFGAMEHLLELTLDPEVNAVSYFLDSYTTYRYSGKDKVIQTVKQSWFDSPTTIEPKYIIIDEVQQIFSYVFRNISYDKFAGISLDEPLEREVVYINRVKNKKIVNIEVYQDSFKLMQDLGKVVQNRNEKEVVKSYLKNIIENGLNI
jgi:hypothetical protein